MDIVDLHTHTEKSDGTFTPTELVNHALEVGLKAIAISDHDTTAGIAEALEAAKDTSLEVIPAIELSTEWNKKDIHIVGLYIDYNGRYFQKYLEEFIASRDRRNKKMCALLTSRGIPIDYDLLCKKYEGSVITRAHYATYMMEEGFVSSRVEAFDRYIGNHAPCYIPRDKITPVDAIRLIKKAHGVPVLAHPILYRLSDQVLDDLVGTLKEAGLVGIEALYSTYNSSEERQIKYLAKKYDLLISGGSDFHGTNKPGISLGTGKGRLVVPADVLEKIKKYRYSLGEYSNTAIFSDMDDTLLDSEKHISGVIYQKIMDYIGQGGHFVLSSGRPLDSIRQTALNLKLPLKNNYIIAYNGALIYDCDKDAPVIEKRLTFDQVRLVSDYCKSIGVHCQGYNGNTIISPADDKELAYYRQHIHLDAVISEDLTGAMDPEKPTFKLLMVDPDCTGKLEMVNRFVMDNHSDILQTFYSNECYLECVRADASKGNAVKDLCKHLNIPIENSIAAGDAPNDISMLRSAGCGVAMKNAKENVKAAADRITVNDCNNNGFIEVFSYLK